MSLSIRTRLTLLIALVFLCVLAFILASGAFALYLGLNEEIDKALSAEHKRMTTLFESEYQDLLTARGALLDSLSGEFSEDLHDLHGDRQQFAVFSLHTISGRRIYSDGGIRNIQFLLPKGFLSKQEGFYDQVFLEKRYRTLIGLAQWGTVVVGMENQTFLEVVDEMKQVLAIGLPLMLLVVLLGGRFLAGLAMRPVLSAARTTEKITLNRLDQRLPAYSGKDEFGKLVETLNNMISKIDEGVKRIQQFTQDVAHELRTPLTIQRGELELLYQQEHLPEDVRATVQKALDRAIGMSKITENLMLLAQSDAGRYPVERKLFCLDGAVREIVEDVQILAEGKPVKVALAKCDPVEFYGDEHLIRRLLINLADNALKHTAQGKIEFALNIHEEFVEITIDDTGIGIPKEDVPRIFDRFYRVEKARGGKEGSIGLGLAICKWIVGAHGGTIRIESEVGKGTSVHVSLPNARL